MKGMDGEQTSDKGTGPESLGHPAQNQKKKKRVDHMEEKVDQVIALGVEAKEFIVKHP